MVHHYKVAFSLELCPDGIQIPLLKTLCRFNTHIGVDQAKEDLVFSPLPCSCHHDKNNTFRLFNSKFSYRYFWSQFDQLRCFQMRRSELQSAYGQHIVSAGLTLRPSLLSGKSVENREARDRGQGAARDSPRCLSAPQTPRRHTKAESFHKC